MACIRIKRFAGVCSTIVVQRLFRTIGNSSGFYMMCGGLENSMRVSGLCLEWCLGLAI